MIEGTIYAQIAAERATQSTAQDQEHSSGTWIRLIEEHTSRAAKLHGGAAAQPDEWRHRLVVIAALCVSAIAAHDAEVVARRPAIEGDHATDCSYRGGELCDCNWEGDREVP